MEGGRADERRGIKTFTEILHAQVTEEEQEGLLSALYSFVSSRRSSLPSSPSSSSPSIDAVAVMGSLPAGVPSTYYAKVRLGRRAGGYSKLTSLLPYIFYDNQMLRHIYTSLPPFLPPPLLFLDTVVGLEAILATRLPIFMLKVRERGREDKSE